MPPRWSARRRPPSTAGSTTSDIRELPFTTKADLRDAFPYGFLAVPLDEVVRLHSSSGTTGNPTVIYHTQADIAAWQDLVARCMYMAGMRYTDVFQNIMGYGLFTGGLGFHYGAEKLGAMTIPIGPGNSKRQIWFMQEFKTTAMHILPSYALRLAGHVREMGLDPRKDLSVRMAFVGAEPHTEETRRRIEEAWNIRAFNSYGLSEMCGPGVAFECPEQTGMHIWEDHFLVEIVDPETGEALPDGECGELVLTTLNRTGTPAPPLPDAGPDPDRSRPLPVRAHAPAHRPDPGPVRRHDDHQRREHLPHAGGADPAAHPGDRQQLPHRDPRGELHGQAARERRAGRRLVPGHALPAGGTAGHGCSPR